MNLFHTKKQTLALCGTCIQKLKVHCNRLINGHHVPYLKYSAMRKCPRHEMIYHDINLGPYFHIKVKDLFKTLSAKKNQNTIQFL